MLFRSDEIGDLPLSLQAKLLRFLQERIVERLGGREEIPVDVRIVCATHQDLGEMIKSGNFREDLYYRLSEIIIKLPALRERTGDAALLAKIFLTKYIQQHSSKVKGFTKEAMIAIENYEWPGNVRELDNKVKRAVIMAESSYVDTEDLDLDVSNNIIMPLNLKEAREVTERSTIQRALSHTGNNISKAAELLGVSRPTLYDLITKHKFKT